jgi:hypothetical protein
MTAGQPNDHKGETLTWKAIVLYLTIVLVSEAAFLSAASTGAVERLLPLAGIAAFLYVITRYFEARRRWRQSLISGGRGRARHSMSSSIIPSGCARRGAPSVALRS